jgi:hypothetical protein
VLRNFDDLLARRTMQSVQSSAFVHLHHTAAVAFHLHAAATSGRARCRRADRRDRIFHVDRSGMVEFQRGLDPLVLFERMLEASSARRTGMRSCTSATNVFGSVIIIVQDLSVSPLSLSRHSSHRPAIVSAGEPSRAVK